MIRQIILTREERERVANNRTVYLFDASQNCVAVLLGYRDLDGVRREDIEVAESREKRAAWDRTCRGA